MTDSRNQLKEQTQAVLCVCPHVRGNGDSAHPIDTAVALRLIGSHGGGFNRLRGLTFNPRDLHAFQFGSGLVLVPAHLLTRATRLKSPCYSRGAFSASLPPPLQLQASVCTEYCQHKRKQGLIRSSCSSLVQFITDILMQLETGNTGKT